MPLAQGHPTDTDVALDAVIAAFKARGVYLNELPQWKANVSGSTLVASGPLTRSASRR